MLYSDKGFIRNADKTEVMILLERLRKVLHSFVTGISDSDSSSHDIGEGMIVHHTGLGEIILENTITGRKIMIKDKDCRLTGFQPSDIDFDKVDLLENPQNAHELIAEYGFGIETFINGVALLWWTLYPDGRYFEDEDGFGGEACNETTVYAFMDTLGRIVIPFQDMDREETVRYRAAAEKAAKETASR